MGEFVEGGGELDGQEKENQKMADGNYNCREMPVHPREWLSDPDQEM